VSLVIHDEQHLDRRVGVVGLDPFARQLTEARHVTLARIPALLADPFANVFQRITHVSSLTLQDVRSP
jgi:hypothetical protein